MVHKRSREEVPHVLGQGQKLGGRHAQQGQKPGGATQHPRSGAAAGRRYPTPEAKGSSQEEQSHVQGVVAEREQEGLEELLHVQG